MPTSLHSLPSISVPKLIPFFENLKKKYIIFKSIRHLVYLNLLEKDYQRMKKRFEITGSKYTHSFCFLLPE